MPKFILAPIIVLILIISTATLRIESIAAQSIPRCEVLPIDGHSVSFQIDGIERFKWNYSEQYPRPFFYPFCGPSGARLTRMGHPGAPDHEHHQSIWFAHHSVNDLNFWANDSGTTIRQKQWYVYQDGEEMAILAVALGWFSPQGTEIMQQDLVAAIISMDSDEFALEIQSTFRPAANLDSVVLGKTNFGFLAIRVAKSLSAHFGDGQLTNSEGQAGEKNGFGKTARWMDYSGSVAMGQGAARKEFREGITCFDHPDNSQTPSPWHIRDDGWMGAGYNLKAGTPISHDTSLTLRYLIHAHNGAYDQAKAEEVFKSFSQRAGFIIGKATRPHVRWEVNRKS